MPSQLEDSVLAALRLVLPHYKVISQHPIKYLGQQFYFDYYIPALRLFIECQGEQHYSYVSYFHGTKEEFRLSKQRDQLKREWVKENDMYLLEIKYTELPLQPKTLFYKLERLINVETTN